MDDDAALPELTMPADRLTRDHFDDGTVGALAAAIEYDPATYGADARALLAARVRRPTPAHKEERPR